MFVSTMHIGCIQLCILVVSAFVNSRFAGCIMCSILVALAAPLRPTVANHMLCHLHATAVPTTRCPTPAICDRHFCTSSSPMSNYILFQSSYISYIYYLLLSIYKSILVQLYLVQLLLSIYKLH